MSTVLLLSRSSRPADVLPALDRTPLEVRLGQPGAPTPPSATVLVDARDDLKAARGLCRTLGREQRSGALLAVFTAAGLAGLQYDWLIDDVLLDTAGPGEVVTRVWLAEQRQLHRAMPQKALTLDSSARTAQVGGRTLTLTYTEFEILRCLACAPGQVVAHGRILDHLYGGEPRGTNRAIQVHLRRIRVKLGPEHARLIQTVHGIGYRLRPDLAPPT